MFSTDISLHTDLCKLLRQRAKFDTVFVCVGGVKFYPTTTEAAKLVKAGDISRKLTKEVSYRSSSLRTTWSH
jgi:hypothetical protein